MMTPEEHMMMLMNLVQSVIESQGQLAESQSQMAQRQAEQEKLVAADRAAIKDLIVVSRTLVDAQKELTADVKALRETVREHEGKIEALIDTVDRIIRRDAHPS
jgi:predicted  nucleic acid-binding Zn-ribbon protein